MKCYLLLLAAVLLQHALPAQSKPASLFDREDTVAIIYYPFYNGQQMVELDFGTPRNNFVSRRAMRAFNWEEMTPPARPNIYLFRDSAGNIVRTFNVYDADIASFKLTPPKKLKPKQLIYHSAGNTYYANFCKAPYGMAYYCCGGGVPVNACIITEGGSLGVWKRSGYKAGIIGGRYGLIDTLGNIILAPSYNYMAPFIYDITEVMLNGKFGVVSKTGAEILPCMFDRIEIENHAVIARKETAMFIFNTRGDTVSKADYEDSIRASRYPGRPGTRK